jgi:hypothetical protein
MWTSDYENHGAELYRTLLHTTRKVLCPGNFVSTLEFGALDPEALGGAHSQSCAPGKCGRQLFRGQKRRQHATSCMQGDTAEAPKESRANPRKPRDRSASLSQPSPLTGLAAGRQPLPLHCSLRPVHRGRLPRPLLPPGGHFKGCHGLGEVLGRARARVRVRVCVC